MPTVNPNILIWARNTANFSEDEAAHKLGIKTERLLSFENGERAPTRGQLSKMSKTYRRPLLVFYLDEIPSSGNKGQDFRLFDEKSDPSVEAFLNSLVRDIYVRQGLIRDALEDTEEDEILDFVGSVKRNQGIDTVLKKMESKLQFNKKEYYICSDVDSAFKALRTATERIGVFVLVLGNLGSFHTDIDVAGFRGFSLADDVAPFIIINEKDARSSWSFTLIHELTHIFLGETGISGYASRNSQIEKFCDSIAAHFLLDFDELKKINISGNIEDIISSINNFSNKFKVSRTMVAYNLLSSNYINNTKYKRLEQHFNQERIDNARKKKEKRTNKSGPDYYIVRKHRIGSGLTQVVKRLVTNGALTSTKAGKILGVKPTNVGRLIFQSNTV